ncbi:mitogen-activated protein kinase kinase kinase 18-like [Silene latifolia]|uniref:mitogen-activated protein kinase kinase kinase 18-like n=1 Tax=Silene latifolia TaxID=37657 RepID=UPI003D7860B2
MELKKGKLIGRGSSADVSLGWAHPSGDVVAVKYAPLSRSSALEKEVEIHSSLKCDQIIEYKGNEVTLENGQFFYNIFMEYASGGTLIDVIQNKGGGLSESKIQRYTRDILRGLEYVHSKGIVHCDIKGANILVTSGGVKIGDFGCSKWVSSVGEIVGTPMYMAPEVARGEQQGYPADVWALGCTVLEMATGLPPWVNISQDPISALYWIGFTGALPDIPGFLSDGVKDFLDKCLKRDPKERWSVTQLLKHPFFNDDELVHELKSDTPTSVLDPSLWVNTEKSGSLREIVAHERNVKSPLERIMELAKDSSSEFIWNSAEDDDDWITVRSKSNDKTEKLPSGPGYTPAQISEPNLTDTKPVIITSEPGPSTELNSSHSMELLFSYKNQNCKQFSRSFINDETIQDGFSCKCLRVYLSVYFSVLKNFCKHFPMVTKLLLVPAAEVCNTLFLVSIFIHNFRTRASAQDNPLQDVDDKFNCAGINAHNSRALFGSFLGLMLFAELLYSVLIFVNFSQFRPDSPLTVLATYYKGENHGHKITTS